MKTIAIITARGGSKRIPKKNIKPFLGKPIIAYSIEAALQSGLFQEVMVSTDDAEIALIAKQYGASIPFLRSAKNADDYATTAEALQEVLQDYKEKCKQNFDFACCIYPTAPFLTAKKISDALELLLKSKADSVIAITKFSFPIWRAFKKEAKNVEFLWPEHQVTRSQDLLPAYHDAGQFYFFRVDTFLQTGLLMTDNTLGLEIPESEVQDIDTEEDWKLAELKYQLLIK